MANVATMVVKIDADIASLTKNLDKAQKAVLKSADNVSKLGDRLSLFVTVPALAAAAALSKFAADAEASAHRLSRTFGSNTGQMQSFIENLRKNVPETTSTLNQMASEAKNLADNLGLTAPAAVQVSKGLLALAGDMAAFKGESSIGPAMEALEKGLAGQTRGLAQYGIVIKEADIQQEAYREGILRSGNQLTETGRAIAAYNLIMQRSGAVQGEAARTVNDAQRQFAFLKSDLMEVGEQIGTLLLPGVVALAKGLRDVLQWISSLPNWVKQLTLGIVAFAATAGPILKLYAALAEIQTLFAAMRAVSWLATLASPIGIAVAAFVALAGAIYAAWRIWKSFHEDATTASGQTKKSPGNANPLAGLFGQLGAGAANGHATDMATGSPLEQMEKHVSSVVDAFKYASETGGSMTRVFSEADSLSAKLLQNVNGLGNVFTENAQKLRDMLQRLKEVTAFQSLQGLGLADTSLAQPIDTRQQGVTRFVAAGSLIQAQGQRADALSQSLDSAIQRGGDLSGIFAQIRDLNNQALDTLSQIPDKLSAAGVAAQQLVDKLRPFMRANTALGFPSIGSTQLFAFNASDAAKIQYGKDQTDYTQSLALKEALAKMPDYFDAAGEATVVLTDNVRNAAHQFDTSWQELKQGFEALIHGTADLGGAMKAGALSLIESASNLINSTIASAASATGDETGASLGSNVLGSFGGTLAGPFGQEIGQVVGSVVGSGIEELGKRIFGIHTKDATAIERDAVVKANTQALQQLTLKMQGFQVNASNTVAASSALSAFFQNSSAVAQLTNNQTHKGGFLGLQTKGDLQSQIDALTPTLQQFGLTFTQLEAIAQNYGLNILDKDGRVVGDALQQLTTDLLTAAQAAFTLANSFNDQLSVLNLYNQFKGATTTQDQYDAVVSTFQKTAPLLGEPTGNPDSLAGMNAWRSWGQNVLQQIMSGSLDVTKLGGFQNLQDLENALTALISPLNTLTNTVNGVVDSLTNVPTGFKVAYDRFLATNPGTDVVGPLQVSGPLQRGTSTQTWRPDSTTADVAPSITITGPVTITSNASNANDVVRDVGVALQSVNSRGGPNRLTIAVSQGKVVS